MVCNIKNYPVRIENVHNDNIIYGYNVTNLKGKTVCWQTERVQNKIDVLDSLREKIGKLTVPSDVIFVKNVPFVVIFLRGVNFSMLEYVSRGLKTLITNYIMNIFQFIKNNIYNIKKNLKE